MERRRLEDKASRLLVEAPGLKSLHIELAEDGQEAGMPAIHHVRRFVLPTAPALFLVPCGDPLCDGGGHNLTSEVLKGLRLGHTRIEGDDDCRGAVGSVHCARKLIFAAVATFDAKGVGD
jgi:hypothetical protein